jgi:glutathione S-transferase
MLRLLGRSNSINVRKVLWLCAELDLACEHEEWGREPLSLKAPEFKALNPNGLVPVLVDGDFVLWESNTICRYLAARQSRTDLLPAEPRERARVEQWMDWQTTELNNAWRYAFLGLVRMSPQHTDAIAIAASLVAWNRQMALLEAQLAKTGAYVVGNTFTLADIVIGLATHRWRSTPMSERPSLPAVLAYEARLFERPGYRLHGRNGTP